MDEPPAHTSTGQSDLLQGQSSASFEDADRNMAPYGSPLAQRAQSQAVADFVAFESDEDEEIDIGEFSLTKPEPNSSATAATPSRIGALGGPKQDHEAGPRQCHGAAEVSKELEGLGTSRHLGASASSQDDVAGNANTRAINLNRIGGKGDRSTRLQEDSWMSKQDARRDVRDMPREEVIRGDTHSREPPNHNNRRTEELPRPGRDEEFYPRDDRSGEDVSRAGLRTREVPPRDNRSRRDVLGEVFRPRDVPQRVDRGGELAPREDRRVGVAGAAYRLEEVPGSGSCMGDRQREALHEQDSGDLPMEKSGKLGKRENDGHGNGRRKLPSEENRSSDPLDIRDGNWEEKCNKESRGSQRERGQHLRHDRPRDSSRSDQRDWKRSHGNNRPREDRRSFDGRKDDWQDRQRPKEYHVTEDRPWPDQHGLDAPRDECQWMRADRSRDERLMDNQFRPDDPRDDVWGSRGQMEDRTIDQRAKDDHRCPDRRTNHRQDRRRPGDDAVDRLRDNHSQRRRGPLHDNPEHQGQVEICHEPARLTEYGYQHGNHSDHGLRKDSQERPTGDGVAHRPHGRVVDRRRDSRGSGHSPPTAPANSCRPSQHRDQRCSDDGKPGATSHDSGMTWRQMRDKHPASCTDTPYQGRVLRDLKECLMQLFAKSASQCERDGVPRTSTDYGAVSLGRVKDAFHRKFAYDIDLRSLGALALSHFISENLQSLCYISIGEPIPGTHPPKSDKLLVPVDLDWILQEAPMSGVDRGAGGQQRHQYPDTDHRPRVGEMERHRLPEQVAVVESFRSTGPRYSGNSHAPEQSCFGGGAIAPRSRSVNRMQAGINSFEVSRGLETGMDNFGLSMERPQNSWDSRSSRHRDDTGAEVQGPACSMSQSLGGMRPVPAVQAFTAQGNEEGDDLTSGFLQLRQHLHSISKPLHAQRDHTPGNLSQAHHAAPAKTGPQNLVVQTVQGFKEYASPASNQAMNFLMGLESSTQQCNPVEEHVLELFQPSTSVRLGQSTAGILQDDPCSEFHGRLQPGPQGMTSATAAPTQCPTPHEIADTGYGHGRPLPVTTSSAHRGVKRPRQSLHRHVEPQQPRGFAEGRLEESHGFQDYEVQMPLGSGLNEATGQVSMSGEKRNRLHPAQPQATRIVTVQKRAKQTPQAQKEYPSWQQEGANASRVLRNQPPVDRQVKESEGVPKEMPGKHERIVFVPKHLPVSERLTRLPPGQSALSPTAADGPVRLPSGPLIAEMPGKRPPKRNKVTEDLRLLLAEKLKSGLPYKQAKLVKEFQHMFGYMLNKSKLGCETLTEVVEKYCSDMVVIRTAPGGHKEIVPSQAGAITLHERQLPTHAADVGADPEVVRDVRLCLSALMKQLNSKGCFVLSLFPPAFESDYGYKLDAKLMGYPNLSQMIKDIAGDIAFVKPAKPPTCHVELWPKRG